MSRLVVLYPAAWRARYEDEFLTVLSGRPQTLADRVDIVRGAVDARLHPQLPGPDRIPDRAGFGPLAGLVSLVAAVLLMANGPIHYDEYGTYRDGVAALPFVIMAMILLGVGLYRIVVRLPDDAGAAAAAGLLGIVFGVFWAMAPWVVPLALAFILGVLGLAVGARRAGILPTWSVVIVAVALAIPAGFCLATLFLPWYAMRVSGVDYIVVLGPLGVPWLVFGALLLRGFPEPVSTATVLTESRAS